MTAFEDLLRECWNLSRYASEKLKVLIPKMFTALIEEGKDPKEASQKIMQELLALSWSKTIVYRYLPEQAKDSRKAEAGRASGRKRREKVLEGGGGQATVLEEPEQVTHGEGAAAKPVGSKKPAAGAEPQPRTQNVVLGVAKCRHWFDHKIILRPDGSYFLLPT